MPDAERSAQLAGLQRQRAAQIYGDVTARTMFRFQQSTQKQFQLKPTDDADQPTVARV